MSKHREWDAGTWAIMSYTDILTEHNATVRAYRDAMAECDRLGKANDEACDRIRKLEAERDHAFEYWKDARERLGVPFGESGQEHLSAALDKLKALESRPVLTWEECDAKLDELGNRRWTDDADDHSDFYDWLKSRLPAPTDSIRVPFSDAQIERMAVALRDKYCEHYGIKADGVLPDYYKDLIRAALAAGGLVPCPAPEYKPEDVALNVSVGDGAKIEFLQSEVARLKEVVAEDNEQIIILRDRLARVSAKSARRAKALKQAQIGITRLRPYLESSRYWREVCERRIAMDMKALSSAHVAAPERASDEELEHIFEQGREEGALVNMEGIRAVRARVEAPLLAEIAELRDRCGRFDGSAQSLSKMVDDLSRERDTLKAELTALKVRVTPHDEQRSECWQILNDALLGLCPTMNLAHAVREAIDTLKARVEELAKISWQTPISGYGPYSWDTASEREREITINEINAILTALRPWLREPTGWELDVTVVEIMQACTTNLNGYQAVLDLCRSRIRPTFECAECAEAKSRYNDLATQVNAARTALEGE